MSVWDDVESFGAGILHYGGQGLDALAGVMGLDADDRAEIKWWFSGVPVIGDAMRMLDSNRKMEDYLRNRNMSWSDMMYVPGASYSPSGMGSVLNFVSSNLGRLYR